MRIEYRPFAEYEFAPAGRTPRLVHWLRMDHWTLTEAAMLFCNVSPDLVETDDHGCLTGCVSLDGVGYGGSPELRGKGLGFEVDEAPSGYAVLNSEGDEVWEEVEGGPAEPQPIGTLPGILEDMQAIMQASLRAGDASVSMSPAEWVEYAARKKIDIAWMPWAVHHDRVPRADKSPSAATGSGVTNSLHTAWKIIVGVAVAKYGYNPLAQKNDATAKIVADIAKAGLTVSDDTVRRHLKDGAEEVIEDWSPYRTGVK